MSSGAWWGRVGGWEAAHLVGPVARGLAALWEDDDVEMMAEPVAQLRAVDGTEYSHVPRVHARRLGDRYASRAHHRAPLLVKAEAAALDPRRVALDTAAVHGALVADLHEDLAALEQPRLVNHALQQRALGLVVGHSKGRRGKYSHRK
jgi:hypothetical protein